MSSKRHRNVKPRPNIQLIPPVFHASWKPDLTLETRYRMQTTFPRLLLKHAAERPEAPAMREKEYGIWQAHSWAGMAALVEHFACGLHQAGLQRGEHMVVIGANRPRLYATMLAVQLLGAIAVPLYQAQWAPNVCFPSPTPRYALRW